MTIANNGVDLESIGQLLEAVKETADTAKVQFQAQSSWKGATKTEVKLSQILSNGENIAREGREYTLTVDEPPQLGGKDEAPNPVEYLAAGLCGCITAGIATNGALFGTEFEAIDIDMKVNFDLHGVLGLDKSVPNGALNIEYTVKLKGPGDAEKMVKAKEVIDKKSPVLNTLELPLKITSNVIIEE